MNKVAKQLVKKIEKMKTPRVGILAFPYHDGKISSGSSIVSERLTTYLAKRKKIRVVERRLISKILEEQRMNETGVIDPNTAQKMGQVLGIDVIVTGTLIDLDEDRTEVNARALDAETGEIISAASGKIVKTWKDRPRSPNPPKFRTQRVDPQPVVGERVKDEEPIKVGYPARRPAYRGYRRYR
jgi:TolB-like protein